MFVSKDFKGHTMWRLAVYMLLGFLIKGLETDLSAKIICMMFMFRDQVLLARWHIHAAYRVDSYF